MLITVKNLISSIDRHTHNGAIYPGEGIGIEENVALIQTFAHRDWLALRSVNLKSRSNAWIKCLIDLLHHACTEEARQMIIHIALTGTEENFLEAMTCIRGFRRDVSTYTWLKLENRSTEIFSKRVNNKFNNYY